MGSSYERTFALIKPEVVGEGKVDSVVRDLEANEFIVVAQKTVPVTEAAAADLYRESKEQTNYPALVSSTTGDNVALILERRGAIKAWRLKVGSDVTRFHAAPSAAVVEQQIAMFFGPDAVPVERTLALIKPGTADKHSSEIKREIAANGFTILAERRVRLSRELAEAFYAEHAGRSFFDNLVSYMSSGPAVAMVLAKPAGIKCWRSLIGPTNNEVAKRNAPNSLRAKFALDGTRNACHGSDSPASAAREIRFFFPDFQPAPLLTGAPARDFLANKSMATVFSTAGPVNKTLTSVLVEGLTELCKSRPAGLAAVEWLGQWLLQHNPRTGFVAEEASVSAGAASGAGAGSGAGSVAVEVLETKLNEPEPSAVDLGDSSVVFLVGGPGSGRTTLAQKIVKAFGYEHISTGDLLRSEAAKGTALGREIKQVIEGGDLVDDATTLALVKTAMKRSGARRFLIDGFPRSLPQAFAFEQSVQQPSFVIALNASEETLQRRVTSRAATSGRVDDAPSAFGRRLAAYQSSTALVVDFYSKLGQVTAIDAEGSEDDVFEAASKRFEPEVVFVLGAPAAGKTTQCARAAKQFGFVHVSTGELLRAEAASGSRLGNEIDAIQRKGDLVPIDIILSLVRRAIDANPGGRFLLDGFPRTLEQAAAFRATVGPARTVISLEVDANTSRNRLSSVKASKRNDNGRASLERRLRVHRNATQPVLDMYNKAGVLRTIDATASQDAVFGEVARALAPTIVFVLGGPGSGKGTQCARLRDEFGYTHLSAGDLLRAEVARNSPDGAMIHRMISQGQIVPVSVVLGLMRNAMLNSGNSKFLVDGFPRAVDQVGPFEATVGAASFVLYFDTPDEVMRARMAGRGRSDDNAAAIEKRLLTFHQTSYPVVEAFGRQGKVVRVDGSGSVDEIYAQARQAFAPDVLFLVGGSDRASVAADISGRYNFLQVSVAELLEAQVARSGSLAAAARDALDSGERAPAAVCVAALAAAVRNSGARKLVVSDFPESAADLEAIDAAGLEFSAALDVGGADADLTAALSARAKLQDGRSSQAIAGVLQPSVALLVGASGSGRGEFAKRAGLAHGYHHLRVTDLLAEEARIGSADGVAIQRAIDLGRTAPVDATIRVIRKAIAASRSNKFLLDGYPRLVSDGFPGVHDQVFALEEQVGPVRAVVCLDAHLDDRRARVGGTPTKGDDAALLRSVDAFEREKLPVLRFFEQLGKATTVRARCGGLFRRVVASGLTMCGWCQVDTRGKDPQAVWECAADVLA